MFLVITTLCPVGFLLLIYYGFFGSEQAKDITNSFIAELQDIFIEANELYGISITLTSFTLVLGTIILSAVATTVILVLFLTRKRGLKIK